MPYSAIELTERDDGPGLRAELGARTGRTSVPSIWIAGACIGGCNECVRPRYCRHALGREENAHTRLSCLPLFARSGPAPYNGLLTMENEGRLDDLLRSAGVAV